MGGEIGKIHGHGHVLPVKPEDVKGGAKSGPVEGAQCKHVHEVGEIEDARIDEIVGQVIDTMEKSSMGEELQNLRADSPQLTPPREDIVMKEVLRNIVRNNPWMKNPNNGVQVLSALKEMARVLSETRFTEKVKKIETDVKVFEGGQLQAELSQKLKQQEANEKYIQAFTHVFNAAMAVHQCKTTLGDKGAAKVDAEEKFKSEKQPLVAELNKLNNVDKDGNEIKPPLGPIAGSRAKAELDEMGMKPVTDADPANLMADWDAKKLAFDKTWDEKINKAQAAVSTVDAKISQYCQTEITQKNQLNQHKHEFIKSCVQSAEAIALAVLALEKGKLEHKKGLTDTDMNFLRSIAESASRGADEGKVKEVLDALVRFLDTLNVPLGKG